MPLKKVNSLIYKTKTPHKTRTGYPADIKNTSNRKDGKYFIVDGEDAIHIFSVALGAAKTAGLVQFVRAGQEEMERRKRINDIEFDDELILQIACLVDRYRIGASTKSEMFLGIKQICLSNGIPWHQMRIDERNQLCRIKRSKSL